MLYRYSGAGNSFIVIDGRNIDASRFKKPGMVHMLCLLHAVDGLMVLEHSDTADFRMEFFNPDGSCGMMCGNGGRCIVAFADLLGVKPFHSRDWEFEAPDGVHRAEILSHLGECKTVRLSMNDVEGVSEAEGGCFLNTGTRHLVLFVPDVEAVDVEADGSRLRHMPAFAPEGTNVNFVTPSGQGLLTVRTFEKGVEAETLACGTGVTASAIAAFSRGIPAASCTEGLYRYDIQARQDRLAVEFRCECGRYTDVRLTGPTLFEGRIE